MDATDRAMLGQVGSAWRALVTGCTALPCAGLTGGVPLKLNAFVGSVARLAWAKANRCPWVVTTCAYIAWGGNLEVLRWAREQDCPWDGATCHSRTPSGVAMGGSLWWMQLVECSDV